MTAAKRNSIVATKPLEPYDGPDTLPSKHATFAEHQAWQAQRWQGRLVAFNHSEQGRCIGRCKFVKPLGRDARGIPDYAVTVQSLTDPDKTVEVHLVAAHCEFYLTEAEAKADGILRREQAQNTETRRP